MEFKQYDFNKKFDEFLNKNYERKHLQDQNDVFRDFYTIWTEKLFSEPEKETEKNSEKDPDVGIIITKDDEEMIIHVKVPGFKKEDFNIFIEENELLIQTNNSFNILTFNNDKVISDFKIEKVNKKIKLSEKFAKGDIKAYLENGILRISIKKSKEFTRNIKII
jgi:hypothetical protein